MALLVRLTGVRPDANDGPGAASAVAPGGVAAVPQVAGLDLATALARMSGLRALYLRTARDFSAILETIVAELQGHLALGHRQSALMCLHTLKGNAGTLGAMDLAAKAAALETLCKAPDGLPACAAQLEALATLIAQTQQQLAQAMALLAPAPSATPVPAPAPTASLPGVRALRELHALAAAQDLHVLERFAELRSHLEAWPGGLYDQLEAALQNLDLDAAQSLCSAMLAQWGESV